MKVMKNRSLLWNFYSVCDEDLKLAKCHCCQKALSFRTTIGNLKHHLKKKHPRAYAELVAQYAARRRDAGDDAPPPRAAKQKSPAWKYFLNDSPRRKLATCIVCGARISYRGTTGNLTSHIRNVHDAIFDKMRAAARRTRSARSDDDDSDDDSASAKEEELWAYFERDGDRARCVVCDTVVDTVGPGEGEGEGEGRRDGGAAALREHFAFAHATLVEQLTRQEHKLVGSDGHSSADGDDTEAFTEVVYLERDSSPEPEPGPQPRARRSSGPAAPKRERLENYPQTTPDDPHDDELNTFTTYIKCLLKKLTPHVFEKVQLDIVNAILNAKDKYGVNSGNCIVVDSKHMAPGVISVGDMLGVGAAGAAGANYSITVAPCDPAHEDTRLNK